MSKPIPTGTKYRALLCAMAVNFLVGSYYTYSNTYDYVAAYLLKYNPWLDEQGTKVKIILPIWLIVQSCCSVLSVRIAEVIGYRTLNFIAFIWFCLNNLAMVFVTDYYVYVLVYGFSNGFAIGFGYLPAMYTAWTYFPESKSIATGVILFCAGISACICSPIVRMIVNPDNLNSNDPAVINRVPHLFMCLTIGYSVITLIACSLQPPPFETENLKQKRTCRKSMKGASRDRKKQLMDRLRALSMNPMQTGEMTHREIRAVTKELIVRDMRKIETEEMLVVGQLQNDALEDILASQATGGNDEDQYQVTDRGASINEDNFHTPLAYDNRVSTDVFYALSKEISDTACPSFKYALTSRSFMLLATMAFCCSIYNYFMLQTWKDIFKRTLHLDQNILSYLLSVGSVANSSFRIIVGFSLMKLSFRTIYMTLMCIIICSSLSFYSVVNGTQSTAVGIGYLFFSFAGLGTMVTIFPTICVKTFGSDVGSKIYPVIYLCFSIASLTAYTISSYVSEVQTIFYIFGGFAFIGLMTAIGFNPQPSWHKEIMAYEEEVKAAAREKSNSTAKTPN